MAVPHRGVSRKSKGQPSPPSPPPDLDAILVEACQDVPGIDPATFLALLSPQDIEDIEGGHIPVITLNAYARSFAEGIRTGGRIRVIPRAALTSRVRCGECLVICS